MGSLFSHQIEVNYVLTGQGSGETCDKLSEQLPSDEQRRAERLQRLSDRVAFLTGRVLVRKMLSRYSAEPPRNWRFLQNSNGKPAIIRTPGIPDFRFNLSHSAGVVAAAVSLGRDIGIDVEFVEDGLDFIYLARAEFAAAEVELLCSLLEEQRRDAFFSIWTLKEAYTKALGTGLCVPLSEFSFSLNPLGISFHSQARKNPNCWFLWQDQPSPSHRLAVAAHRLSGENLTCGMKRVELTELF